MVPAVAAWRRGGWRRRRPGRAIAPDWGPWRRGGVAGGAGTGPAGMQQSVAGCSLAVGGRAGGADRAGRDAHAAPR